MRSLYPVEWGDAEQQQRLLHDGSCRLAQNEPRVLLLRAIHLQTAALSCQLLNSTPCSEACTAQLVTSEQLQARVVFQGGMPGRCCRIW